MTTPHDTLFDLDRPSGPLVRASESLPHNGTPTSKAAAESMRPHAQKDRERVLEFIRSRGERGATDEEIAEALAMNPSTSRPRRIELQVAGLVVGPDMEYRKTKSGRDAQIWVAAEFHKPELPKEPE